MNKRKYSYENTKIVEYFYWQQSIKYKVNNLI